jgi:predicted nucleotidyltransferase
VRKDLEKGRKLYFKDKRREKVFLKIIEKIKKELTPKKIIIFGSIVNRDFSEISDIDIAVETDKPISYLDCIANFDIVNLNKVDEKLKNEILKTGYVYYEKS